MQAKEILDEMWNDERIRLIGVRLDKLVDNVNYQCSLFDTESDDGVIDNVVDVLKEKYGNNIINKASLKTKIK